MRCCGGKLRLKHCQFNMPLMKRSKEMRALDKMTVLLRDLPGRKKKIQLIYMPGGFDGFFSPLHLVPRLSLMLYLIFSCKQVCSEEKCTDCDGCIVCNRWIRKVCVGR